jgi:hypothetical protein
MLKPYGLDRRDSSQNGRPEHEVLWGREITDGEAGATSSQRSGEALRAVW